MILHERWERVIQHIKLVVELLALVLVVQVYDLNRGKFESAMNNDLTYFNGDRDA